MSSLGRRVTLIAMTAGIVVSLATVAAIIWADLFIQRNRAGLERVPAHITRIRSMRGSHVGRGISFHRYEFDVRFRWADGTDDERTVQTNTYGFPSKGDSITLLVDPRTGHVEANPLPEIWIVSAVAYAIFGCLIWFFVWAMVKVARMPVR